MTGRGLSVKSFKTKDLDGLSDADADLTESNSSLLPLFAGRGRGLHKAISAEHKPSEASGQLASNFDQASKFEDAFQPSQPAESQTSRISIQNPFRSRQQNADLGAGTSTASSLPLLAGRGRGILKSLSTYEQKPAQSEAEMTTIVDSTTRTDSDKSSQSEKLKPLSASKVIHGSSLASFAFGRGRGMIIQNQSTTIPRPGPSTSQESLKQHFKASSSSSGVALTTESLDPKDAQAKIGSVPTSSGAIKKPSTSGQESVGATETPPVQKHGNKGREFEAVTNCIPLKCQKGAGVFEYEVKFLDAVDSMKFRKIYLYQHKEVLGTAQTFDGVTLNLPRKLADNITKLISTNEDDDKQIRIEIVYKKTKRLGDKDSIQLYNVLFDRIYNILNYLRVGRKFYDPSAPHILPNKRLEVWPGYVKAVEELEGGLMLTLDVSHRLLSTRCVLEQMTETYQSDRERFKDNVKKDLIGKHKNRNSNF